MPKGKTFDVRIAVIKDTGTKPLKIRLRDDYTLKDASNGKLLKEGKRLRRSDVAPLVNGIIVAGEKFPNRHVIFNSDKTIEIRFDGITRKYRGRIEIINIFPKGLMVVNTIDVEDYIRGVLYHEVTDRWPMEAMKAQAIAARTYALYQTIENSDQDYDVTSDIYSQVYGGRSAERYRTNLAVKRTRGQILMYHGEVFPAYFHASCGGHTEDVSEMWDQDLAPLKGKKCGFCSRAPHWRWKKNLRLKDVQDALNRNGYDLDLIKDISVMSRNKSGRIRNLQITTRAGTSITIPGKKFRAIVGPNVIKSNKYSITMKGYYFDIEGSGWGHGVGLCQWGAYYMAKKRYSHQEILQFYYPGTDIRKLEEIKISNDF